MERPKISIIVPTYNQGRFIAETLSSIQNQSFRDYEVIIHDSLSNDQTQQICESFSKTDPRFKYFREKDQGQSDAINRGLDKSMGQYFTWICSDDTYHSNNALEVLVSSLDQAPAEAIGVFGLTNCIDENSKFVKNYTTTRGNVALDHYRKRFPFAQPSSLLRMDKVKEIGGVRKELHLSMDQDMFIRLLKPKNTFIKFVPHTISNTRLHHDSKTTGGWQKAARECLMVNYRHFGIKAFDPTSVYVGLVVSSYLGPTGHKFLRNVYNLARRPNVS